MRRTPLLFGFSLIFLAACSYATGRVVLKTDRGEIPLTVEIADTDKERARGLMFREKLEEGSGMLFVFEDEAPRGFWMKNTLIPLDIVFLDRQKKVVSFVEKMEPCVSDPCPSYVSEKPAMYALELPAQSVKKYRIRVGNKVIY
jgi:uncharacterized membrane protein (UPF0127 family)